MPTLSLHITYETTSNEATKEVLNALKEITEEQVKTKFKDAVTFMFSRPNPEENIIEFTEIYSKSSLYWEKGNKSLGEQYKKILDSKNLKKQESFAFGAVYQKKFNEEGNFMKTLKPNLPTQNGMILHNCFVLNPNDKKTPVMLNFNFKPKDSSKISELKQEIETVFMKKNIHSEITSIIIYEKSGEVKVTIVASHENTAVDYMKSIDFSFLKTVEKSNLICYEESKSSKDLVDFFKGLKLDSTVYRKPDVGYIINPYIDYQPLSLAPYAHNGSYFGPPIRSIKDEDAEIKYFNQIKTWITRDSFDINKKDFTGKTMLFYACEGGFISCVKYLLDRGAKIENENYQPLCQACLNYSVEIIKMLIKHGADVNVKDHEDFTPLDWLLRMGKDDEELLSLVDLFSQNKLDINTKEKAEGDSYLHLSTRYGLLWTSRRLINLGSELEATNNKGNTVLLNCCEKSHGWKMDIFRLIQQRGGDIKAKNKEGNSALHLAAKNGLIPVVNFLATKLNINDENAYGNTPIMEAALYNRNVSVIQHLISHKANLEMKNNAQLNVIDLALLNYNLDVCYVLLARFKRTEMVEGISNILPNFANVEKQMIEKKIDLDKVEEEKIQ
eukprot:gene12248-5833_t